ncbi:MAG: hypothetical protein LBB23_03955 [Rickettsiales bacterium]|jgi:hypothetical protein|nr:hypothetical protein [Rickettsiales bacterium]
MIRIMKTDLEILQELLKKINPVWDARKSILEMKKADFQWRQMEWFGFYFELLCREILSKQFQFPGEKYGTTTFDLFRTFNWDLKAHAANAGRIIQLNDCESMRESIKKHGFHGEIVANCDIEYNDHDRSFQKWHTELKGGKSDYEIERESRTTNSRLRKTAAELKEIIFVILSEKDLPNLDILRQGRNSNGAPRPDKYGFNLDNNDIKITKVVF